MLSNLARALTLGVLIVAITPVAQADDPIMAPAGVGVSSGQLYCAVEDDGNCAGAGECNDDADVGLKVFKDADKVGQCMAMLLHDCNSFSTTVDDLSDPYYNYNDRISSFRITNFGKNTQHCRTFTAWVAADYDGAHDSWIDDAASLGSSMNDVISSFVVCGRSDGNDCLTPVG